MATYEEWYNRFDNSQCIMEELKVGYIDMEFSYTDIVEMKTILETVQTLIRLLEEKSK